MWILSMLPTGTICIKETIKIMVLTRGNIKKKKQEEEKGKDRSLRKISM
jgi:hypothetical protein